MRISTQARSQSVTADCLSRTRVFGHRNAPPPVASMNGRSWSASATARLSTLRNAASPRVSKICETGIPTAASTSASLSAKGTPSRHASRLPMALFPLPINPTMATVLRSRGAGSPLPATISKLHALCHIGIPGRDFRSTILACGSRCCGRAYPGLHFSRIVGAKAIARSIPGRNNTSVQRKPVQAAPSWPASGSRGRRSTSCRRCCIHHARRVSSGNAHDREDPDGCVDQALRRLR